MTIMQNMSNITSKCNYGLSVKDVYNSQYNIWAVGMSNFKKKTSKSLKSKALKSF